MRPVAMRFKGHTWHHNPKSITVICSKTAVKYSVPYFREVAQSFYDKLCTIKGIGELYGEDCIDQYNRLCELYNQGGQGVLCLPSLPPMYACFSQLKIIADNKPSVITYEFAFTQTKTRAQTKKLCDTVVAREDQTLWDIAYENLTDVDTLLKLNPDIMFLNDLKKGKVITVC